MRMHVPPVACLAFILLLAVHDGAAAQSRMLILDEGGGRQQPALLAVETSGGSVLAKTSLGGRPGTVVRSPDGARMLVYETAAATPAQSQLDRDMGRSSRASAGDHSLALLDAASLKRINTLWLGPAMRPLDLRGLLFSPDGRRVMLIVDNFKAPKKIVLVHRALVSIDLESGDVAGWVALPKELERGVARLVGLPGGLQAAVITTETRENPCRCWADARFGPPRVAFVELAGPAIIGQLAPDGDFVWAQVAPDGRSLLLAQRSASAKKNAAEGVSRVRFVDLATREVDVTLELSGVVALESHVAVSPDRKLLYLLDAAGGRLDVVSLDSRSRAATLQVGENARFALDADTSRVMVLSSGTPSVQGASPAAGRLHVMRDAGIASSIDVVGRPFRAAVSEGGDRLYVLGGGGVTVLSWPGLEKRAEAAVALPSNLVDALVTRDGRRCFTLDADGRVEVIDIVAAKRLASLPTAPPSASAAKRWALFSLGTSVNALLLAKGLVPSAVPAAPPWEAEPAQSPGVLAARADGEYAYAFNPDAGTVTVIEAASARVAGSIAAPGQSMFSLPGGHLLAVGDTKAVRLIDMAANKVGAELAVAGEPSTWSRLVVASLPGDSAVVARGGSCYIIDALTGAVRSRLDGLKSVVDIIVER